MKRARLGLVLCALLGGLLGGELYAQQAETRRETGRALYERGEGSQGGQALIGEPPTHAPLSLFACGGCHGEDGRGKTEGGVVAPQIRWSYLTRPYDVRGGPFRLRPAYDEKLFARALRDGIDSGGRRFSSAMPRYELNDAEIASLNEYLRVLGEADLGERFGQEIPIGVRLPATSEALSQRYQEMARLLSGYFDAINQRGGIFERKIKLFFLPPREPFGAHLAAGLDLEFPRPAAEILPSPADEVPVLALFPTSAPEKKGLGAPRFTLYSGPDDRAAVLSLFARRRLGFEEKDLLVLGPAPVAQNLAPRGVLYTGQDAEKLRLALVSLPKDIVLLLTGWLENPGLIELAEKHQGAVYVATPPTHHYLDHDGRALLHGLGARAPLAENLWALAAAKVLEAALEKAGRDLHPRKLEKTFEKLSRVETGLGPPLRFAPSRHLGARGAVVLQLGKDGPLAAELWLELD